VSKKEESVSFPKERCEVRRSVLAHSVEACEWVRRGRTHALIKAKSKIKLDVSTFT
jgi:hypothetical protein